MNKFDKYKIPIFISLNILVLISLFGMAYAYFKATVNNAESASTISIESGELTINYQGNTADIVASGIVPGWSETKKFTLSGKNTTKTNEFHTDNNLYYKIILAIDNNTFSEGALTYSLAKDSTSSTNGKMADEASGTINQSGNQIIGYGYFSETLTFVDHIYNLTISFPSTEYDQSADNGKSFAAHVTIGEGKQTISEYISKLDLTYNGLEIDDTANKNLRSVGASPKNYLKFNNETWRIVGVFNNITTIDEEQGKEKKESLVKIVRNDSLGDYSWDSSESTTNDGWGVNEWSQADLMYELNCDGKSTKYCRDDITEGYLSNLTSETTLWFNGKNNAKNGTYEYRKNIRSLSIDKVAKVRWNLGGYSTAQVSALNMYNAERGTLHISNPSDGITRKEYWDGKIALIYPSDYGYASTDQACRSELWSSNCKNENWLFNSKYQWTLSPYSGNASSVFNVYSGGDVDNNNANGALGVRPALFLKSDVVITGGTGDEKDPYTISNYNAFRDDSWATIANNVKNGNTSLYNVGDTRKITVDGTNYTVRLANNSTPSECDGTNFSQTACGFVVEFVDIVERRRMNSTYTNVGGWSDTEIRTYANGEFFNKLPSELQNVIMDTKVISGHGSEDTSNLISTDKIYLLSSHEIWSNKVTYNSNDADTAYSQTRQLDYYSSKGVTTDRYSDAIKQYNSSNDWWWLRTATYFYSVDFLAVYSDGAWRSDSANNSTRGFAPAFRIGEKN